MILSASQALSVTLLFDFLHVLDWREIPEVKHPGALAEASYLNSYFGNRIQMGDGGMDVFASFLLNDMVLGFQMVTYLVGWDLHLWWTGICSVHHLI